jgi:hypothetical protein
MVKGESKIKWDISANINAYLPKAFTVIRLEAGAQRAI